ncbi:hypothetical protein M569_08350 [Genlisea aurea]|uniref:Uncharacterized protein n=1 Tax=Genlisea aurea TaxID=192259 RepID=S8E2F3_9LAMI|nr:hypothetical protein M569_08350 [Genlisea aurea]
MEPKKTTQETTPSSSEIPGETIQMALALQALPENERRFLAAFLTGGSAASTTLPTTPLEKPEEEEKEAAGYETLVAEQAGEIPAETRALLVQPERAVPFATLSAETERSSERKREEKVSVGINLETDFLTSILQEQETGEKKDENSDEETESDGESLLRRTTKGREIDPLTAMIVYVPRAGRWRRISRSDKTPEGRNQPDEQKDVEMTEESNQPASTEEPMEIDPSEIPEEQRTSRRKKRPLPTRMSQRILRSQSQTGKGKMTDIDSDEKSSSAGNQPEEEEDKDSEPRTVHKGKRKMIDASTPRSSMKHPKVEEKKDEESIYRIDWAALDQLGIRNEVEAYLTNSNLMELINPRGQIDTEHTRMFYNSVQLTRYHDLDDVCLEFRLGDKLFIRTLRKFAVESGLATEAEAGSQEFDDYEMRWGDKFNPHKAYQRLTGVPGQWNKSKSVNRELTDPVMGYIQFLIAYNLTGRTRNFFIPTKFELWLLDSIKAGKKINPATVAYHTIEMAKKQRGEQVRKIGHVITNFAIRAGLSIHEEAMKSPMTLSLALMERHAVIRKPEKASTSFPRKPEKGLSARSAGKKKQPKSVNEEEEDAGESGGCTGDHSKGCQKCEWAQVLFMVKEMYISSHRQRK